MRTKLITLVNLPDTFRLLLVGGGSFLRDCDAKQDELQQKVSVKICGIVVQLIEVNMMTMLPIFFVDKRLANDYTSLRQCE